MPRPAKDGMYSRFATTAMAEIRLLAPDFQNEREANQTFKHFIGLKTFVDLACEHLENPLPQYIMIENRAYRCTDYPRLGMQNLTLPRSRANPLELLHYLAHYLQPTDSAWHRGEFGAIFLRLVERKYGADIKRQCTDIMLNHGLKTWAKSPDSRLRQSQAYRAKQAKDVPMQLVGVMDDMRRLMGHRDG